MSLRERALAAMLGLGTSSRYLLLGLYRRGELRDQKGRLRQLGLVLLKAGRAADAERVFREDLKRFPENVWSLQGVTRALAAQNRGNEAEQISKRLRQVWSMADVRPGLAGL